MGIDVLKLTGVSFPTRSTFLSADLAKIGDAVLMESQKNKINNKMEFQKGGVFIFKCDFYK
jgi:hypothetical protein